MPNLHPSLFYPSLRAIPDPTIPGPRLDPWRSLPQLHPPPDHGSPALGTSPNNCANESEMQKFAQHAGL